MVTTAGATLFTTSAYESREPVMAALRPVTTGDCATAEGTGLTAEGCVAARPRHAAPLIRTVAAAAASPARIRNREFIDAFLSKAGLKACTTGVRSLH